MENNLKYPQIMEPGALKRLNEHAISQLGTPLFFAVPDPIRPRAQEPVGAFYEVITGLYVIYKDYGTNILKEYLNFCKSFVPEVHNAFVFPHYTSANSLRGGLCHGGLPNGSHIETFLKRMEFYLPFDIPLSPGTIAAMSPDQCQSVVNKLSSYSDQLVDYIQDCTNKIAVNPSLLMQWREHLVYKVFNKDEPQYGKGSQYFNERIVRDLEQKAKGNVKQKPHQEAVKNWLVSLEPKLLHGTISNSDELSQSLLQTLVDLYTPFVPDVAPSSANILLGDFAHYFT